MIKNGKGGGNTRAGLVFEGKVDLSAFLSSQPHYCVEEDKVFYDGQLVARVFKKHSFYKVFLKELNIDWTKYLSKQLLPDDCIFVLLNNMLYIKRTDQMRSVPFFCLNSLLVSKLVF